MLDSNSILEEFTSLQCHNCVLFKGMFFKKKCIESVMVNASSLLGDMASENMGRPARYYAAADCLCTRLVKSFVHRLLPRSTSSKQS